LNSKLSEKATQDIRETAEAAFAASSTRDLALFLSLITPYLLISKDA
jgi:hypothetical protein